jgi:hypothetical protein
VLKGEIGNAETIKKFAIELMRRDEPQQKPERAQEQQ